MDWNTGLVITGGHAPRGPLSFSDADCLVVAADSGLDVAHRHGITPHAIVGDMDSLENSALLNSFPNADVQVWDRAKDYTDTEIALKYLWDRSVEDITLVGGGGGRLDHLLAISALFERDRTPRRWVTDREEVLVVEESVEFTGDRGDVVSFLPVGPNVARMRSEGLRWNLDGLAWHRGDVGISNECTGGRCRVDMLSGRLLMVRELPPVVQLP